jgi:UPF0755 protein
MIYVKFHTFVEELYQKIMGKKFLWLISVLIVITAATTLLIYSLVSAKVPCNHSETGKLIYIDRDDNADSVCAKAEIGWRWNVYNNVIKYHLRTGCYRIKPGTTYFTLYRQLRNGIQEPVKLIVPSTRTISKLASILSQSLMVDSAEIASVLTDSIYCSTYGYTRATIPALFIPNSYEVYWNISVDKLMERMERTLARLVPECREVYRLHIYDGMGVGQIAKETCQSYRAVEYRIGQARQAVRQSLSRDWQIAL